MPVQETMAAAMAALSLEYDFALFPCEALKKTPATAHGCKDATRDEQQFDTWFNLLPESNVAIATGKVSGIVVVDIDTKTDPNALENARKLCGLEGFAMLDTLMVKTPSGGQHWYFKSPDFTVRNSTNIVPGVDIRAEGGYVVAPPSVTDQGDYTFLSDWPPVEMPDALRDKLREAPGKKNGASDFTWGDVIGTAVAKGGRNDALTRFAGGMWKAGLRGGELFAALLERNNQYNPPLSPSEVKRIVRSAERNFERREQRNRLLKLSEIESMPRPVPLINGVLYSDTEHCLFGAQGTSKTFLVLDWALHIVHGHLWNDRPVQPGRVVYVCGEGGGRVLADRMVAWLKYHGIENSDVVDERLRITEFPVPLLDTVAVDDLLQLVKDYGDVLLVIIDTLSANFGAGNENDQGDMGRFCGAARRIRLATKAGIIVVHHTGHVDKSRPQGANRIRRDFDVELRVDADDNDDTLFGLMGGGKLKNRNGVGCGLIAYRLESIQIEDDDGFGQTVSSLVVVPTQDTPSFVGQKSAPATGRGRNQGKVIDALTWAAEKSGQSIDGPDGVILSTFELAAARKQSGLLRKRWNEVLKNFEATGIIKPTVGGMKWFPSKQI